MSNSNAILYTLILWIFKTVSKIWFPHMDLRIEVQPQPLLEFGGLNSSFFMIYGGLSPSSLYVEPPLREVMVSISY